MWLLKSTSLLLYCLCCSIWQAQGQLDFDSLTNDLPVTVSSSPSLEHRAHVSHFYRNVSAPAPGPAAGAPASAQLPPKAVAGVAHSGAPAAEGPQPGVQLQGPAGTFSQLPKGLASPPGPVTEAADNATMLNATQTFTPAAPRAPAAFVADDGTLVLMSPSSPSAGLTSTGASADHMLWWVVSVIALVAILASIGWAYSRNRSRRYMDLKEADSRMTEMAAQQRHDPRV